MGKGFGIMCGVFERANLAQLAELHLAKVEVEGSSPLVRSILLGVITGSTVQARAPLPSGDGTPKQPLRELSSIGRAPPCQGGG